MDVNIRIGRRQKLFHSFDVELQIQFPEKWESARLAKRRVAISANGGQRVV